MDGDDLFSTTVTLKTFSIHLVPGPILWSLQLARERIQNLFRDHGYFAIGVTG